MFKYFVLSLFLVSSALAQDATIRVIWDANQEPDLAGYKIYYGQQSRNYTTTVNPGNATEVDISNLDRGTTYFFAVTAYDQSGNESDFSQEVSILIPEPRDSDPPARPVNVKIQIVSE